MGCGDARDKGDRGTVAVIRGRDLAGPDHAGLRDRRAAVLMSQFRAVPAMTASPQSRLPASRPAWIGSIYINGLYRFDYLAHKEMARARARAE